MIAVTRIVCDTQIASVTIDKHIFLRNCDEMPYGCPVPILEFLLILFFLSDTVGFITVRKDTKFLLKGFARYRRLFV